MKSSIIFLAKVLMGLLLLARPAQAAVTFTAGSSQVSPGEGFILPITASGFTDVTSFQFVLSWDKDVIEFSSVNLSTTDLPSLLFGNFGTGEVADGKLRVSWNYDPTTFSGISTLFAVNFNAIGAADSQSLVLFGGEEGFPIEVSVNLNQVFDSVFVVGNVSVVPEPINIALGVFAGLFAGTTTLRWILRKQSARSAV